jgi:hypothetical protein
MSGGGVKALPRQTETNLQGLNPRKGSGVIKANPLGNGYGPLLWNKTLEWRVSEPAHWFRLMQVNSSNDKRG